jgi:hypothetical protein
MMHVTYSRKSLLIEDEAAVALIEYARVLAASGGSDTVTLRAIGAEGNIVNATFLLTPSTILMVESANADAKPPENREITEWLLKRIRTLSTPNRAAAEDQWESAPSYDDLG